MRQDRYRFAASASCRLPRCILLPMEKWHSTTVVCVRHNGKVAMASDGQVTLGTTIMKHGAAKIRRLKGGDVIAGLRRLLRRRVRALLPLRG